MSKLDVRIVTLEPMQVASVLGFVLMSLAETAAVILLTVGFFVFSNAMLRPAIMSLTSKMAQGGQGAALGMNNAFQSLGRVAGPLWAGLMFDLNLNLPYWSAALILLGTFGYALRVMRPSARRIPQPAPADVE